VPAPAADQTGAAATEEKPAERSLPWRIFGAAAVAVVALVGVGTYLHLQSQITAQRQELSTLNKELRKDLAAMGGSYADMVKKDDHTTRLRTVWDTLKELRADRSDLTTMKERCALLAEAYKAGEEDRRVLAAEVRRLRESKTAADERDGLVREIRSLRERIAQIEGKPKAKGISAEHVAEQEEP
jgi:Tfp pilus assembly protein PilN